MSNGINTRRLEQIEKRLQPHGDAIARLTDETSTDVLLAALLLIKVGRDVDADWLRESEANYRSMQREDFMAMLPQSYTCGACGQPVPFNLDAMMRQGSKLPDCSCRPG